jgi:hypothetical protein
MFRVANGTLGPSLFFGSVVEGHKPQEGIFRILCGIPRWWVKPLKRNQSAVFRKRSAVLVLQSVESWAGKSA